VKRFLNLALFAIILQVDGSTATILSSPDGYWAFIPMTQTCIDVSTMTPVAGPPPPCVVVPPAVSTGPVIIKASNLIDCYKIDGINPNGTLTKVPGWVVCP
jgi:hypothetical protein